MRHVRPPAMTRTRRTTRRHWTSFAAHYALPPVSISAVWINAASISAVSIGRGRAGYGSQHIDPDTLLHRYHRRQAFQRNAEPYPLAWSKRPTAARNWLPDVTTITS